jgi:ribosomal protein S27E
MMFLARNAEKSFTPGYQRHKPEQTLLYQIIEHHYPEFQALMEAQNRPLPIYVQQEFDEYLKCSRLEYGFLRVKCEQCHDEKLVAFSCKKRGFCPSCGARVQVQINHRFHYYLMKELLQLAASSLNNT